MMGFAPNIQSAAKAALITTRRVVAAAALAAVFLLPATPVWTLDAPPSLERLPEDVAKIDQRLDKLYADLPSADPRDAEAIQQEISAILSSHGSPTLDLILQRGRAALSEGDSETAIEHFTRLIELAPDFAEAWNMRATAYYLEDRLGESVTDIAQVLAREPRHFGALWGLGLILQRIGSDERALKAFRAAVALNPHLTDAGETIRRLAAKIEGFDI
jgi:tetratricopeptide (TPR) repeat protein